MGTKASIMFLQCWMTRCTAGTPNRNNINNNHLIQNHQEHSTTLIHLTKSNPNYNSPPG